MKQTPNGVAGIALVIVLGFLVLITVFMVAFFTSVTTDAKASSNYVKGVQTRQLADSAVSLAMAQIKEATTLGSNQTWASQPGLIRTFDTTGHALNSYKLYSSSTMKVAGALNVTAETDDRKNWATETAHLVDLNRPARDATGTLVYPILDPKAGQPASGNSADQLQGFRILSGAPTTASSAAPMPVRWIYILAQGDLVFAGGSGAQATITGATKDNPVVGRIAFWTDDETCKVNINTAAGDVWNRPNTSYGPAAGSYWDVPRTFTAYDKTALANFQPAQGEYQRYPGHPATTYLSAVFPTLSSDQIGQIASRVQTGGSLGGTVLAPAKVVNDADRLYASIDELIFDPNRADQPVTKERLERGRFFLTANSRAPETNLFNLPRIAIWPIHHVNSTAARSAYDRLIAFCSTIAGQPYFFDRASPYSPTADFSGRNQTLYSYLQRITNQAIPGFGGQFSAKYGTDRDQILTEIVDYIRCTNLFDDTVEPLPYTYPTHGMEFTSRRTSQTGVDPGHGQVAPLHIGSTMGFGRFYTISEAALHFICTADQKVPESNLISGAGANRTLQQVLAAGEKRIETMLVFEMFSPAQGWTGLVPDMQIRVRGLDTFKVNGTSLGFPADGTMRTTLSGTSTYHGRAWGGTAGFRYQFNGRRLPVRGTIPADSGASDSNKYPFISIPVTVTIPPTGNPTMAFTGGELTVDLHAKASGATDGTTLVQTLKIKFPDGTFPIPDLVTTGTPEQVVTPPAVPASSVTTPQNWWSFSYDGAIAGQTGRLAHVNRAPGTNGKPEEGAFIRAEDVIRSVLPQSGDYRLVAAKQTVPNDVFVKHRYYDTVTTHMAHSLMEAVGFAYVQGPDTGGRIITGAPYDSAHIPDIPANITTATTTGDFDTGVAYAMDGAYINKPDEGNNYRGATGTNIPYFDNNQAQEAGGPTFFSPNRQVPSAVMFGSLSTGVVSNTPWRTLLFRPDTSGSHPGAVTPKDHLLLDLFWMPVVEPYAISEPFSTAGKVNMNYQIAPFTYLERTTALRALFRSERVTAIPTTDANVCKSNSTKNYRNDIDADATLTQFQKRFDNNDVFRSASEVCEMHLVPVGQSATTMAAFWTTNALTGDNLRERPYAGLYPRLTTKSNTYSVHVDVQSLRQLDRSATKQWTTWNEGRDQITGEYRGTAIVERYLDLEDTTLPDFAQSASSSDSLDQHCKLRVIMNRKFSP